MTGAEASAASAAAAATPPREQLALLRGAVRRAHPKPVEPPAAQRPVAKVAVDLSLSHLDRPFDYLVPESLADSAVPGARVRVRVAGQDLDGFVLERCEHSEYPGRLERLRRVVAPEPVLAEDVARLARLVADRYAGTLADVLRLAVPPRVARVERETGPPAALDLPASGDGGGWSAYPGGAQLLAELGAGRSPRAVWTALPGADWPRDLGCAVAATLASGRGAVVVVPDRRDVDRVDAALGRLLGPGRHVALTADLGPAERYRRWLRVRRGGVRAVVGTRAAAFAPVSDLGLVVVWDDGDDLHAEPRAPYPHVREVLCLRAHDTGAAALLAGSTRTAEGEQLLRTGWAVPVLAERAQVRVAAPRVVAAGDDAELARDEAAASARLPTLAWRTAKEALARGPVLVQVPRRGYLPALSCRRCHEPARCARCAGPLMITSGHAVPACRWCGRPAAPWRCSRCEDPELRAAVVGARRTAEELGRAFPGVPVRTSGRDGVLAEVGPAPALVVATPGAEPVAEGGYGAALLLDGWALLGRADLRAGEEALRRWLNAASLVRPAGEGGTVVVLADAGAGPVQALVRWDPATSAGRELDDRSALGFPPAARVAALVGAPDAVADLLAVTALPAGAEVLGPVPVDRPRPVDGVDRVDGADRVHRALVRVPRAAGGELAAALRAGAGVRSARKAGDVVRVQIDPVELA